jgi:hypothetical protein
LVLVLVLVRLLWLIRFMMRNRTGPLSLARTIAALKARLRFVD